MSKIKSKQVQVIQCSDWDKLVQEVYGRPYCFQQQEGCQARGVVYIGIPCDATENEEMHDSIPEIINGNVMGVKFKVWLERDPNAPLNPTQQELDKCSYYWGKTKEDEDNWKKDIEHINMFYERNFYPDLQTVANDLYEKGHIDAGNYSINIDW